MVKPYGSSLRAPSKRLSNQTGERRLRYSGSDDSGVNEVGDGSAMAVDPQLQAGLGTKQNSKRVLSFVGGSGFGLRGSANGKENLGVESSVEIIGMFGEWWQAICSGCSVEDRSSVTVILWSLWNNRNNKVWNGKCDLATGIIHKVFSGLSQWRATQKVEVLVQHNVEVEVTSRVNRLPYIRKLELWTYSIAIEISNHQVDTLGSIFPIPYEYREQKPWDQSPRSHRNTDNHKTMVLTNLPRFPGSTLVVNSAWRTGMQNTQYRSARGQFSKKFGAGQVFTVYPIVKSLDGSTSKNKTIIPIVTSRVNRLPYIRKPELWTYSIAIEISNHQVDTLGSIVPIPYEYREQQPWDQSP
ncbi:hypothetical protein LguiA_001879 [Lonicera macranthoides]